MKVSRIYKINVGVALLYFVIVLATTILTMIMGVANQNNMALRIILCTCFSILMIFISFENYKDGKSIFDKTIESKIIKMCIIFYYIFLALSTMFYIYESIAQYKAMTAFLKWEDKGIITIGGMMGKGDMEKAAKLADVRALGASL